MGKTKDYPIRSKLGEPVYELATEYPPQGSWTESEYLHLHTNKRIEFNDGMLEFLPIPTRTHQEIIYFLIQLAKAAVNPEGDAWFSGLRVRTSPTTIREPDVVVLLDRDDPRGQDLCFEGADLVMEVVSGGADDRKRDLQTKREEYAAAGIREYWIVDPKDSRITVLTLKDGTYAEACVATGRELAKSALVEGLQTEAERVFLRDPV